MGIFLRPTPRAISASNPAAAFFRQAGFVPIQREPGMTLIASTEFPAATARVKTDLLSTGTGNERQLVLELRPNASIQFADSLLYWEAGNQAPTQISNNSILLGPLAGTSRRRFILPPDLQGKAGHLIIYSQAQQQLVATFPFVTGSTPPNR
ncbi:MAG: hypothetical protein F6K19_49850 [Cyanothece sp. SIO1E1]|nr:hypothetical protein [Cyanothece sp. SIO1E1]